MRLDPGCGFCPGSRYKLRSQRFLTSMFSQVRSFVSLRGMAVIPGVIDVLRDLLWLDYKEVDLSAETDEANAVRKLHVYGMVALEGDTRWVW